MVRFNTAKELFDSYGSMDGQDVKLAGWARTTRASKNFGFIEQRRHRVQERTDSFDSKLEISIRYPERPQVVR